MRTIFSKCAWLLGKQMGACMHNCFLCHGHAPFVEDAPLITIQSLLDWCNKFEASGMDTKHAKMFKNVVHKTLLQFPPETPIIKVLNIPELHLMIGIATKLLDYVEKTIGGEAGTTWVSEFLVSLNISRSYYQGRRSINGNDARTVLREANQLEKKAESLTGEVSAKVMAAVKALTAFNSVVASCFAQEIKGDYKAAIATFSKCYRAIPGITVTPKVHIVEKHVAEFLDMKAAMG